MLYREHIGEGQLDWDMQYVQCEDPQVPHSEMQLLQEFLAQFVQLSL